jgi:monoamine oxidase
MPSNLSATYQQIRKTDPKAPVALVIGSGFGGLAAAVRMCAKGWRVRVLEKLNEPRGRACSYRRRSGDGAVKLRDFLCSGSRTQPAKRNRLGCPCVDLPRLRC